MKILVVDDVQGWRDYHVSVLTELFPKAVFYLAESAQDAYNKLIENNDEPFDIIITDMQMEVDFEPKYAGEWLVEQTKNLKNYARTRIVIISAAYNINHIAEMHSVDYIRKSTARTFPDAYSFLKK